MAFYLVGWTIGIVWAGSSRRRMIFRSVGTTLLLFVLVVILEIPAAIGMVDYAEVWTRLIGEWVGPTTNFVNDWDIGFHRPPNTKWSGQPRSDMAFTWNLPIRRPAPMTFTTDSRGFRNLVDRDEADIVLLGDSYVEGAYNSDDETCAAVLERLTGEKVCNLAEAGYGTLQELEVLTRYAIPMKPRLVAWFFFEGNDLYDDEGFEGSLPYLREHKPIDSGRWNWSWEDFLKRSFTRTTYRTIRRGLEPLAPNNVANFGVFRDERSVEHRLYFYDYASISFGAYEKERFEKTKAAFRRGSQACEEHGIQLVLFYIPMKYRVYSPYCTFARSSPCLKWTPWNLAYHFRQFCDEESIAFVDLVEPMREAAAAGKVLYAPEDSHWNVAGHAFVAERLRDEWERYRASAR